MNFWVKLQNLTGLGQKVISDPNAPQPKPWHSCSGSRPLLTNKKQNSVFQDFPPNLHLIPQCNNGREETVLMKYGYDMRHHFEKTREYPYSTQVFLRMRFPSYDKFTFGQGSGTFIGPNIILTAAHNVRNINKAAQTEEDLENEESIEITPGAHQKTAPFGIPRAKYVKISPQYTVKNLNYDDHDWALIILDRPIGNETGWLGIASLTDEELKDRKINLAGYPGDKDQLANRQLWGAGDTIKKIYPERFSYWIDTAKGQSGSGVWIWPHEDKEPYIVGVHVLGPDKKKTPKDKWENQATRLTPAKFKQIASWIGEYAYKDPLYKSLENWSDDFWDKDETKLNEAQKQIIPHLVKEGPFVKECLKGFMEHSLKSGYLSIFTSINSSISELELSGLQIGDEWVKILAENKTWPKLDKLILDKNNIGVEGVKALAANKTWKELRELSLSGNYIGGKGAQALAENKTWSGLRSLILDRNNIGDEGAKAIAVNEAWRLLSLSLSENHIGGKGAQALAACKTWPKLDKLILDNNHIGDEGAKALATNETWRLSSLILDKNNIGDEGAKTLASMSVEFELSLKDNKIGDNGAQALVGSEMRSSVFKLVLSGNRIGDETAKAIATKISGSCTLILDKIIIRDGEAKALPADNLSPDNEILDPEYDILIKKTHDEDDDASRKKREQLVNNCSQESDKKAILIALFILPEKVHHHWLDTTLQDLDLWNQQITCEGAKIIAANKWWSLKKLKLSSNKIGDEGTKAITKNTVWPLEHLILSYNVIGDEGAQAIANNTVWPLEHLILGSNIIGDEGAKAIAKNTVWPLKHLDLGYNGIGTDGALALARNRQWRLKSLDLRSNSFPVTQLVFLDSEIAMELKIRFGADVVDLKERF